MLLLRLPALLVRHSLSRARRRLPAAASNSHSVVGANPKFTKPKERRRARRRYSTRRIHTYPSRPTRRLLSDDVRDSRHLTTRHVSFQPRLTYASYSPLTSDDGRSHGVDRLRDRRQNPRDAARAALQHDHHDRAPSADDYRLRQGTGPGPWPSRGIRPPVARFMTWLSMNIKHVENEICLIWKYDSCQLHMS